MTYDTTEPSLPVLGSAALAVVARLVENGLVGPALIERLKRDGRLTRIRDLHPDEPPTLQPFHAPKPPELPASSAAASIPTGHRFDSIDDFHSAFRSGTLTPLDVAERFLARHAESDTGPRPLRAFIAVRGDDVLRQAEASTERWKRGAPLGAFDGVPVAIKDEMDVAGYPTTVGTAFLGRTPATEDCTVAARLRAAGALLVGKANMHEIGIDVTGLNPHHGTARNPYDDGHHTGASSSGPGAAVGSGLTPIGIGADGGGSIRIPSAHCGIVGLKATYGRVSEFGAAPLCWSLAYIGPMTATARDCARTYAAIAGPDPRDPNTAVQPAVEIDPARAGDLTGVRLGVFSPFLRHATPDVVARTESLLRTFVERGATLHEVELPELDAQRVAHIVTITGEMASAMERHYAAHRAAYGRDVRINVAVARSWRAHEYVTAQRLRTRAIALWEHALSGVHAIITPSTGQTAPPIHEDSLAGGRSDLSMSLRVMRFAQFSNLTGHPAISMPAGYDANGLPVGLQAIGHAWSERLLLRIADVAEQGVERRAPQRWYPLLPR
jgi:Asp-tRNA(Asn)/Glu-tRNA(Gln) amidotransferase A subunit family amidase